MPLEEIFKLADLENHRIYSRGLFAALVDAKGNIGTPGLMTEKGLAQLVWRGAEAFFVTRGFEQIASVEDVEELRKFSSDLAVTINEPLL